MAIKTLSLKGDDSNDIAAQARAALADFSPALILFFASSIYDPSHPAKALQQAFPDCKIIGSSSHSEFCGSVFSEGSVSLMAMDSQSVPDVCIEVIPNIRQTPDVASAVQRLNDYFGGTEAVLEGFDRYVGLVLFESSAKAEERVMQKLGTTSDILFVGGSSSAAENGISRVYAQGKSYQNAAVLALLKTANGYDIIKTQSASVLGRTRLLVTKSDVENRILYEFNHHPCGKVYASVLGIPVEEIENHFVSNPLGIVAEGNIFIRTFDQIKDGGITLHCGIPQGSEVAVLQIGDIVKDTQADLDRVITQPPAGVINFNCLYRTFEMLNKNLTEPYCALFGRYPSIGFSTSGEAFLGHINETSTVLVIR